MKNCFSILGGLLLIGAISSCGSVPPVVTGSKVQNLEGTFLYSIQTNVNERTKELMVQQMTMGTAALFAPTAFKVENGTAVFESNLKLARYSAKKLDWMEKDGYEIGLYRGSYTAEISTWSGKVVKFSLPLGEIKTTGTQGLIVKALLSTGLKSGTFKLVSAQFISGDQGEVVLEVGP